jgi:hypothetical protein
VAAGDYNQSQNFAYRGINSLMDAMAPMLAEAGLMITPKVLTITPGERATRNGGVMITNVVRVEYTFVSTKDGTTHIAESCGEGFDSGDKSLAKAMTAAYKSLLIQSFCIPLTGTPDADGESPGEAVAEVPAMPAEEVGVIRDLLRLSETDEAQFSQWIGGVDTIEQIPGNMAGRCRDALNNKIRKLQDAAQ